MVPTPHRDGSILDWATDATRAINRFGASGTSGMLVRDGVGGVGFEPLPENRRERRAADAPVPFTVRWSTADGETGTDGKPSGAFVVYLPSGALECEDNSLMSAWSNYLGDLEPAVADDWYLVPGDTLATGILYLAVTVPVPDPDDPDADPGDYSVEFAQTTDGNLVNVPVADLTVTAATSTAPATHSARQLWVGSVILFDGVTGGSGGETPGDADVTDDQQSIETTEINGASCHQLHDFADAVPEEIEFRPPAIGGGGEPADYPSYSWRRYILDGRDVKMRAARRISDPEVAGEFLAGHLRRDVTETGKVELVYDDLRIPLPPYILPDAEGHDSEDALSPESLELVQNGREPSNQWYWSLYNFAADIYDAVVGFFFGGSSGNPLADYYRCASGANVITTYDMTSSDAPDGIDAADVLVRVKGEDGRHTLKYAQLKIELPPFQPGDSNRHEDNRSDNESIDFVPDGTPGRIGTDADESCFQLHDFSSAGDSETIRPAFGETFSILGSLPTDCVGDLVVRISERNSDGQVTYRYVAYKDIRIELPTLPPIPEPFDPASDETIQEIVEDVDDLKDEVAGCWKSGGTIDTCHAQSATVGTLTIGETPLDEDTLKKLLALIPNS